MYRLIDQHVLLWNLEIANKGTIFVDNNKKFEIENRIVQVEDFREKIFSYFHSKSLNERTERSATLQPYGKKILY